MKKIKHLVNDQIEHNKNKNLFYHNLGETMFFTDNTYDFIKKFPNVSSGLKEEIINYTTQKSLAAFYGVNQFHYFDSISKENLKKIYIDLFEKCSKCKGLTSKDFKNLCLYHYHKLKLWLEKSNSMVCNKYASNEKELKSVICKEYSAEFQIELFKINIENIKQPVLDIGCGQSAKFVEYLKKIGINIIGIDRLVENDSCTNADWLTFDYGCNRWGTIISNLGFSNHFIYHHLRNDNYLIAFAKKYIQILNSLKVGGVFYYAPDLSFIEKYLDPEKYIINKGKIGYYKHKYVKIKKNC